MSKENFIRQLQIDAAQLAQFIAEVRDRKDTYPYLVNLVDGDTVTEGDYGTTLNQVRNDV